MSLVNPSVEVPVLEGTAFADRALRKGANGVTMLRAESRELRTSGEEEAAEGAPALGTEEGL